MGTEYKLVVWASSTVTKRERKTSLRQFISLGVTALSSLMFLDLDRCHSFENNTVLKPYLYHLYCHKASLCLDIFENLSFLLASVDE